MSLIKTEFLDSEIGIDEEQDVDFVLPKKFEVNRLAIQKVDKEDQALELQKIDGLSVYNQETFEAAVLQQVDDALEQQVGRVNNTDSSLVKSDKFIDKEYDSGDGEEMEEQELEEEEDDDDMETELERRVRLGEMTPFGTTLMTDKNIHRKTEKTDIMTEMENYLKRQLELQQKKRNSTVKKKAALKRDPLNRKILKNMGSKKKRKKREQLGTDTLELCPYKQPGSVPGEEAVFDPETASGSEYVPSEGEEYSSEEEKRFKKALATGIQRKTKKPLKRKYPDKLPEDWRSDDSDWDYSDEENSVSRKCRKKELDDGDIDTYNRRIRQWEKMKAATPSAEGEDSDGEDKFYELEGDYKIPLSVWNRLYNYQRVGVRWLWELDQQNCGGLLGDEMGLGKTIQLISFLSGLHYSQLKDKDTRYRGLGPSLIVCPTTVMHQWVKEFHTWCPVLRVAILHESGTFVGKQRNKLISSISNNGGILITSYTGVVQYKDDIIMRKWHYVVLDEGHKIRNPDAKVTLVVKQLKTSHRLILSGSPLQNNLKELWSLFDFIFPGKLGTLPVFLAQFAVPITQGGYANASQVQVATAFKCATVLKDSIKPYLLRRMKSDVKSHIQLPEKNEQVLFCRLTEEQRRYYKAYLDSGDVGRILQGKVQIFMGLITLRKICNHPDLYSGGVKLFKGDKEEDMSVEERFGYWGKAGKMVVVETLLKIWKKQGHRVLLFTQSKQMLCILEAFVRQSGYTYLKLDGGTSISARQPLINKFNQDTSYFVMLLTTKVGGLGVNLTGANRVLIYDPDWNPATDTQARERAWRIGQKQSVTVYRLITAGTIEEKMYHRQIFKQFLTNKVLKDPRQRRFFKSNDLFELFTLKETDVEGCTETAAIFAGTGSEVKLDPNKSYRSQKPKIMVESQVVKFSQEKIECMKKLAHKLSQNFFSSTSSPVKLKDDNQKTEIAASFVNNSYEQGSSSSNVVSGEIIISEQCSDENNVEKDECNNEILLRNSADVVQEDSNKTDEKSISNDSVLNKSKEDSFLAQNHSSTSSRYNTSLSDNLNSSCGPSVMNTNSVSVPMIECQEREDIEGLVKHKKRQNKKKKHKHDKKRKMNKIKDAKFEGERVPHLVKYKNYAHKMDDETEEEQKNIATQDEYVLKKLFDKSGLQTALKHDAIMEGGPADYALVEGEAERVAKQAVEALKESRRQCWRPSAGIPTFTGQSGLLRTNNKPQFGLGSKKSSQETSSTELLQRIRQRNGAVEATDNETKVVSDIQQFISSQGGTASTKQLVSEFEKRLPAGSSPLFKSVLGKICTFYRAPDNNGYWTLKDDFNW